MFRKKPLLININQFNGQELLTTNNITSTVKVSAKINFTQEDNEYKSWKNVPIQKKSTVFSFRIPKKEMQQIKFISSRTGLSINSICLMSIQKNNRTFLKELEELEAFEEFDV